MFALPPVQLSRAEIEARVAARRESSAASGPLTRTTSLSSNDEKDSRSLHESSSPTSQRTKHSSTGKIQVSSPVESPSRLRVEHPKSGASTLRHESAQEQTLLASGFGERPRKAPVPPQRSTAPPEGWFSQPRSGLQPPPMTALPFIPPLSPPPQSPVPQVPDRVVDAAETKPPKNKKKRTRARSPSDILRLLQEDPFNNFGSLTEKSSKVKSKDADFKKKIEVEVPSRPRRAQTAPADFASDANIEGTAVQTPVALAKEIRKRAASARASEIADVKSAKAAKTNTGLLGVRGSRIDKSSKRSSADMTLAASLLDLDELYSFARPKTPPRKSSDTDSSGRSGSLASIQVPWRRGRKGETMSMLLDGGFFQISGTSGVGNIAAGLGIDIPPPLAMHNKELPPTPSSIVATPTQLYHKGATKPTWPTVRNRKQVNRRRSPLSNVSSGAASVNGHLVAAPNQSLSPSRLSAIPENAASCENSPPLSRVSTPVATQIHLRGGSVVTVCPPEVTAWQRSIYIQGPIKLPKPVIVPRKNSVASLEPFQEMVDQVYQEALHIPRRRSDEQAQDDVCDFFDDFGFDDISFEGDVLCVGESEDGTLHESDDEASDGIERFSTPPAEPTITPVEKVVAQEVVELLSTPRLPPVDTEESLRARGIARLAHRAAARTATVQHARKDSATIDRIVTIPEEPRGGDQERDAGDDDRHVTWQDMLATDQFVRKEDVAEMDGTTWLVSGPVGIQRSDSKCLAQGHAVAA